jgi:hypothetical protein
MPFLAYSQCTVEYWDLEKRINESDLLVEATVLESKSVWDDNHHNIYTLNTLKVYKVFKGELEKDQITLVTMGGTVGLEAHHAHPSLEIQAGQTGIFILSENGCPVQADKGFWMATASYQSLILYDLQRFKAIDSDREFESIRFELYPYISEISKQELKELSPYNPESGEGGIKPLAPSVIDSFSLDTVTGGSGEVLTIYGTNFGFAKGAQGKVGFKDANFGDGRYYYSPVSWTYVSWSNSQIQV